VGCQPEGIWQKLAAQLSRAVRVAICWVQSVHAISEQHSLGALAATSLAAIEAEISWQFEA